MDPLPKPTAIPFVKSGSYPVRSGNSVRPLIDGEPAFRRICEAIEAALHSVWLTVTFLWDSFHMPDGRGSALDVLDRAAARGLDVRIIFWRPDAETERLRPNAFWGSSAQIRYLEQRGSGAKVRWDRAHPGFCQHQKSWLIDAGTDRETAFVGGINLNPHSMVSPGHYGEGHNHDVYVEIVGPSTVDVHHNFVQRWNEASELLMQDGQWGEGSESNLHFPIETPSQQGTSVVQIQRTVHAGRFMNGTATPEGICFDIASGERSNLDQYLAAIDAARRTIYIENQYVDVPEIVAVLKRALERGVHVVLLMPADPVIRQPISAERIAFLNSRAVLGSFENMTLAGIAGLGADGRRKNVYVHSKLMLVDDEWATVGSCNLHRYSLFGNCEMNVAFSDPAAVRALRCELLREHLAEDTCKMDDLSAFRLLRSVAKDNRRKFEAGDPAWQGLAFELDISTHVG